MASNSSGTLRGLTTEQKLDQFAVRSFRDTADEDYVAARMAYRAQMASTALWLSHQALEKYLKCILLLHRVKAANVGHDLIKALALLDKSSVVNIELTLTTKQLLSFMNEGGRFRYFEVFRLTSGQQMIALDRAVWELRRYCTNDRTKRSAELQSGIAAERIVLPGGRLEEILAKSSTDAGRKALVWANGFFGKKRFKRVRLPRWFSASNAPLQLHPEILDDLAEYVFLPQSLMRDYREYGQQKAQPIDWRHGSKAGEG